MVQSVACCGKMSGLKTLSGNKTFFTENLDNPLNILDQIEGGNLCQKRRKSFS
jgi:hypothetical protein